MRLPARVGDSLADACAPRWRAAFACGSRFAAVLLGQDLRLRHATPRMSPGSRSIACGPLAHVAELAVTGAGQSESLRRLETRSRCGTLGPTPRSNWPAAITVNAAQESCEVVGTYRIACAQSLITVHDSRKEKARRYTPR